MGRRTGGLPRRGRLVLLLAAALLGLPRSFAGAPAPGRDWLRRARIAGLGLHETMSDASLEESLARLAAQGVTVVEADSSLSDYLSEADFTAELAFIRRAVKIAHARGLRIVWYYPALEVITPDGGKGRHSIWREHPDWVQRNFDRKTFNRFVGSLVFWVEPTDESAWMCPNSPFRDFFYGRVKRLAETGLDGLWLDVPLFNSIVGRWPCADSFCRLKFSQETGETMPRKLDFRDRALRRWVAWRHKTLADFLRGAHDALRKVNPEARTVVEVVSCDHLINSVEGLDATTLDRDLDVVWELDAISDTTAMADASREDWKQMMVIYKFCAGASAERARWAFTYGFREHDAQLVMASALAAQVNPYETRIPQMALSVGQAYRARMFGWINEHSSAIFESTSRAEVAVVYSPASRDYVDGARPGGFYLSPSAPNPGYHWVNTAATSLSRTRYLAEYRGWAAMLLEAHVPFDILTSNQVDAAALSRYRAVILPGADALSDAEHARLAGYARQGGTLIVTGPNAGTMNEFGDRRAQPLWSAPRGAPAPPGKGRVIIQRDLSGRRALLRPGSKLPVPLLSWLKEAGVSPVLEGEDPIYVQAYARGPDLILHLVNYGWTGRKPLKPSAALARVSLPWEEGRDVGAVAASEPGLPARKLAYTRSGGRLSFSVPFLINALVTVQGAP